MSNLRKVKLQLRWSRYRFQRDCNALCKVDFLRMWIFPSVHIFSKTHCKETEISTKRECAYFNVSVKFSGECSWEIVWKSYIVSISVELERSISTCDVNSPDTHYTTLCLTCILKCRRNTTKGAYDL